MEHQTRLRDLLVHRSLERGDFVLASGARSSYYIDARKTLFSAEGQYLLGLEGFRLLRAAGWLPRWVGGLTMGADPIAYAIAHRSWMEGEPIDAFSVRKQAKDHGMGSRIEGGLPAGVAVVVVEDTLTSGASALKAVDALESWGCSVSGVLCVVDREAGGRQVLEARGLPVLSMYTAQSLLDSSAADPRSWQDQSASLRGMTRQR
jgi:orotate phosphoribosyltransferase